MQPSKALGAPPRDSPIHGTNRWPSSNPALQPAVEEYAERMSAVGAAIMRGIALGLGLHETFFQDRDLPSESYWCIRILHYPPLLSAERAEPDHGAGSGPQRSGDADDKLSTAEKALSGMPSHLTHSDHLLALLVSAFISADLPNPTNASCLGYVWGMIPTKRCAEIHNAVVGERSYTWLGQQSAVGVMVMPYVVCSRFCMGCGR